MKKTYQKPVILIENFSLNTSIAGDCEKPFSGHAQFICAIPDDSGTGMTIFGSSVDSNCVAEGNGDKAMYDGFCYHIPSASNQLFNS